MSARLQAGRACRRPNWRIHEKWPSARRCQDRPTCARRRKRAGRPVITMMIIVLPIRAAAPRTWDWRPSRPSQLAGGQDDYENELVSFRGRNSGRPARLEQRPRSAPLLAVGAKVGVKFWGTSGGGGGGWAWAAALTLRLARAAREPRKPV